MPKKYFKLKPQKSDRQDIQIRRERGFSFFLGGIVGNKSGKKSGVSWFFQNNDPLHFLKRRTISHEGPLSVDSTTIFSQACFKFFFQLKLGYYGFISLTVTYPSEGRCRILYRPKAAVEAAVECDGGFSSYIAPLFVVSHQARRSRS